MGVDETVMNNYMFKQSYPENNIKHIKGLISSPGYSNKLRMDNALEYNSSEPSFL